MSICRPSCHIICDGSDDKQFVSEKQIALNAAQRGVARKQHDDEQSEDDLHRVERMYPSSPPQLADLARVTTRMTLSSLLVPPRLFRLSYTLATLLALSGCASLALFVVLFARLRSSSSFFVILCVVSVAIRQL